MEGKFPSKILAFVTATTHNSDSIFCWSQMFHILPSICEGFILPSEIEFFERAFWVHQKFFVAKRHFSCSDGRAVFLRSIQNHLSASQLGKKLRIICSQHQNKNPDNKNNLNLEKSLQNEGHNYTIKQQKYQTSW